MSATLTPLKLNRIIVHEVLLASDWEVERKPTYSDEFLELDPKGHQLFCKRLTDSLGSDSHSVELAVELDSDGSAFDVVTKLLDVRDKDFVKLSQDLAARLTNAQTAGTIKAGIVVVVDGTMGRNAQPSRFVAVLKAESDAGFVKGRWCSAGGRATSARWRRSRTESGSGSSCSCCRNSSSSKR